MKSITYNKSAEETLELMRKNGIDRLYHFTDISNLDSIVENGGLYSLSYLKEQNITASFASDQLSWDLDGIRGLDRYVSLSFVTNLPMYWKNIYKGGNHFVWLEIDIEVATWKGTMFSDINATDHDARIGNCRQILSGLDLDFLSRDYSLSRLSRQEKKQMQAEVLVRDFVPLDRILNLKPFERSA